jgi:hypothetical protein
MDKDRGKRMKIEPTLTTVTFEDSTDPVNKPSHYRMGDIECIDYIKDTNTKEGYEGYLEGNAKKYLHRHKYKGKPVEDIKKCIWYLQHYLMELERK